MIKSEIEAVDRLPSGEFGPPMPVSPPDLKPYGPRITRGPSGEVVVLWSLAYCPPVPCDHELLASTRPPGGRFGAPEQVAITNGEGLLASQVQIASDGTVVALWRQSRGPPCMYCFEENVKAARRPPGGRFGSPETLGHLGGSGPWLTLDADDRAIALWGDANTERFALDRNPRVFAAEAPPHEAFGRGTPLQRGGDALGIVTGDGQAIAAWTRNRTVVAAVHQDGDYCRQSISRRSAQPDGDIAANSRGDAVAVWAAPRTYRTNRVMVAVGPADDRSPVVKRLSVIGRVGVRPRLRFVLSEAAEVHISVERRVGRRYRPVRSLVRSMPAGPNEVSYSGWAGRLRPGRYRALIGARDCDGHRSKSQAVPFVVNR